jgi:PelA/Pel-15E family pectate lyase
LTISYRLSSFLWALPLGLGIFLAASGSAMGRGVHDYLKKSDAWYASAEADRVAANILSWQADRGGWPKNVNTTIAYLGSRGDLRPTFDNSATTDELRFLARVYNAGKKTGYRDAFLKGVDYILSAQYPTGGWPQDYPPGKGYHRHITFNDDAMTRLMEFLREVSTSDVYRFVDQGRRDAARSAFERGIECILRCQIKVDGRLTAWCAQHDELNYEPRPGRSYELVSLSGAESARVLQLLMSLDRPSPRVVAAIEGAVAWFEAVKIAGIRIDRHPDPKSPKGTNKIVVHDPSAPAMWARFYEIGANRPIFSDRDGVKKYALDQIGYERRNGYAWYGTWPQRVLNAYPAWKAKH